MEGLPYHSQSWREVAVQMGWREESLGAPIPVQSSKAKSWGFCPKMSLSADFSELAFQERPSVYSADTGWKSDSDRFEAYCNERRQANRAACQGSTRVR